MCCRYYVELSPELRPIIEAARHSSLAGKMVHDFGKTIVTEGEVRPTDIAPVIAPNSKGVKSVFPMIWGFIQPDRQNTKRSAPLFNARWETADTKPTFRECWQRRRCIVPASWYFEWEHRDVKMSASTHSSCASGIATRSSSPRVAHPAGDKYAIQPSGASVTWLAGLYRLENGFPYYTILTREPGEDLARIHDRMPVILPQNALDDWINPNTSPDIVKQIARNSLTDMIFEKVSPQQFPV